MTNLFLTFLEKVGRKRVIYDRQSASPYLERYYLFLKERKTFPFNIFLHHFLRSDPDDVHDHPWPFATLILKGGYWEWLPEFDLDGKYLRQYRTWRGPGYLGLKSATSYHRVELEPGVDCWTLFMPGPQQREWGFLKSDNTWIKWDEYIDDRTNTMHL